MTARRGAEEERGTVLLLMPVAVLILVVLGAICVDFAVVFLAERELSNAASAAANDAATRALDLDVLYAGEAASLDASLAQQVAAASVTAEGLEHLVSPAVRADVEGDVVTVTVSAEVATIFARALPGGPPTLRVSAEARATAVRR